MREHTFWSYLWEGIVLVPYWHARNFIVERITKLEQKLARTPGR